MNRKEFGKLLAVLRKQHRDTHDHLYTQAKLAEVTGLSETVISNLERGTKENLKLANTLHLTTQERKEFILVASNVDETQIYRTDQVVQGILVIIQE